jgi:leucine dehydrogenase
VGGESLHIQRAEGVEMVIAIDSTRRGPALGGCRWKPYADLDAARREAEALARAMTRKAALARLALGGGKAVVCGDPRQRTRAQLLAFAEFVDSLGGRYITAADMGTGEAEMAVFSERTRHVVGLPGSLGGCGDPGPWTARGVEIALEVAAEEIGASLQGLRVAVQGAGNVGGELVRRLRERGARLTVADCSLEALARLPADVEVVAPERITSLDCDVFAPCGPPGAIDAALAEQLRCRIVCGAANNPLREPAVAARLARRGILYVPDFLANAGGLIHLAVSMDGGDAQRVEQHLAVIADNLRAVIGQAKATGCDPASAAEARAAAG